MMVSSTVFAIGCLVSISGSIAFTKNVIIAHRQRGTRLFNAATDVEKYLAEKYPSCSSLLSKNGDAMKKM